MSEVVIRAEKVQMVPLSEIKLNPKNRNKHPQEQIDRLVEIIKYQGFRRPVTISNRSGLLSCGEGRYLAAKKLKLKEIPAIFQDYDSEEQEYADGIADNAVDKWAELDFSSINNDLGDLGPDFDIDLLGIKNFTLDVAEKEELTDPDEVPEVKHPISQGGDIWILGEHRLMCGDSTVITDVEKLMNGEKAQTFFTDPPYGNNVGGLRPKIGSERIKGKGLVKRVSFIENDKEIDWLEEVFNLVPCFLETESTKMVFFKWDKYEQIKRMASSFGEPSALCVWDRVRKASAFFRFQPQHELCFHWGNQSDKKEKSSLSNVWREPKELENNELHPTVKPIAIIDPVIRVTTEEKKIVLDLFGGSGSTLIACEKTNRKCFMMELDQHYCDVIINRWQNYTGKQAKLESTSQTYEELKAVRNA